MDLRVVHKLFDNVQNLNSHEDVATAVLATMFEVSNTFTTKFHETVFGEKTHSKIMASIKKLSPNGFWLCIGYNISKANYPWLKLSQKTSFKPDIWLSYSETEADSDKAPAKAAHILIESKYGNGCLTAAQKKGFSQIGQLKEFGPVLRLLIHTKKCDLNEFDRYFDETITWADAVNIASTVIEQIRNLSLSEAEAIILDEILEFLKWRLAPEYDIDDYSGRPLEKEGKFLHDILYEIRNRIGLKELIYPKEWKNCTQKGDLEYWCEDDKYLKGLKVGDSKKYPNCEKWIFAVKTNRDKHILRYEIWSKDGGDDQPANLNDLKSIGLSFKKRWWIDEWFNILQEVERFVNSE